MKFLLEKLTKTFQRDGNSILAVDSFSVSFEVGENIALVGPNGCGKTTLANLISGTIQADDGKILINGRNTINSPLNEKTYVGRIYQKPDWQYNPDSSLQVA